MRGPAAAPEPHGKVTILKAPSWVAPSQRETRGFPSGDRLGSGMPWGCHWSISWQPRYWPGWITEGRWDKVPGIL